MKMVHIKLLTMLLVLAALFVVTRMPGERTGGAGEHDAGGVLPARDGPHRL